MKDGKMRMEGGGDCGLKLLAAMAILAVAFVVMATMPVALSNSEVSGVTEAPTISGDGTDLPTETAIAVSSDTKYDLKSQRTSDLSFTLTDGVSGNKTVRIERDRGVGSSWTSGSSMFKNITITVSGAITLVIHDTNDSTSNWNVFTNVDLNIENGATVFLEQEEGTHGMCSVIQANTYSTKGNISIDNGTLILHCNKINAKLLKMEGNSQIIWESVADSTVTSIESLVGFEIGWETSEKCTISAGSSIELCEGTRIAQSSWSYGLEVYGELKGNYQTYENQAWSQTNRHGAQLEVKDGGLFEGTVYTRNERAASTESTSNNITYSQVKITGGASGASIRMDSNANLMISGEVAGETNYIEKLDESTLGMSYSSANLALGDFTVASGAQFTVGPGTDLFVNDGADLTVNGALSGDISLVNESTLSISSGGQYSGSLSYGTMDGTSFVSAGSVSMQKVSGAGVGVVISADSTDKTISLTGSSSVLSGGSISSSDSTVAIPAGSKISVSGSVNTKVQNSGSIYVSVSGDISSSSISGSGTTTKEPSFIPVPRPDDDPVVIVPDSTGSDSDDGKDAKVIACAAAACVVVILAAFILVDTRHR